MDTKQFTQGLKVTDATVENFRQNTLPSMQIGAAKAKDRVENLINKLEHKQIIFFTDNTHLYAGAALFILFGSFIVLVLMKGND